MAAGLPVIANASGGTGGIVRAGKTGWLLPEHCTAAGLAAAIPAVIFYNYFLNRVRSMTVEMDNFSAEVLNIVERHYVKR